MVDETEIRKLIDNGIEKAKNCCESGKYNVAESFCRQILKIEENATASFLLGVSCAWQDKKKEAIEAFNQAETWSEGENKKHVQKIKNLYSQDKILPAKSC